MKFNVDKKKDGGPRTGLVETNHGSFETPAFVPVGTKATVKSVLPDDLKNTANVQVILGNTYHLFLQPAWTSSHRR